MYRAPAACDNNNIPHSFVETVKVINSVWNQEELPER
jgi:hypothetical protein